MALKDKLNQIIGQLTGDGADAQKQLLREAITEADTMSEALIQANNEAKTRKEKLRDKEAELSDLREKMESFTNLNPELERLKKIEAQYAAMRQSSYESKAADWSKKAEIFTIPETDKRHAKVTKAKDQFMFADDKTKLTDEQLEANIKAFGLLEMAGYFEAEEGGGGGLPRPREAMPPGGTSGAHPLFTDKIK